jgi:hypothetical protein
MPSEADERITGGVATCPACGQRLQLPSAPPPLAIPVAPAAGSIGIPDEDAATLRAGLPADFPAAAQDLGVPRYRVERRAWTGEEAKPGLVYIGLGLAALAFALFCVLRIKNYFLDREENFAPGAGFPWINLVLGVLVALPGAVLLCRLGVRVILKAVRDWRTYAVVSPAGFVLFDGRRWSVWRWADIATLNMQAIDQRTLVLLVETNRLLTKYYRLRHRDGTEYQFWSTQGSRAAQFGYQVEQETYRLMMPDAVARLQAGESVSFGPFEMRGAGLVYREQFTAWADLGPARIDNGSLRLEGIGPTRSTVSVLLEKIDNHHVFLPLLDQKVPFRNEAACRVNRG